MRWSKKKNVDDVVKMMQVVSIVGWKETNAPCKMESKREKRIFPSTAGLIIYLTVLARIGLKRKT